MKKRLWLMMLALVLCMAALCVGASAAAPCTDGQHTWYYGNPNCTECGAPLRAAVSWESSRVGGYYTEVKNAFKDAQQHPDAAAYEINLLADATLDGSVAVEHKGMFLRLNGCTLTLAPGGNAQSTLRVLPGGYLWIREGNTSGGKIVVDPAESDADWVAGIELAGGKATFEGGELSVADPYNGSAECSVVRMTGSAGNVFDMDWASVLSGEGSYAVVADGSGPEVNLDVKGEKTYGRIKITENYPGSVRLYKGMFAGLELEPGGKYQSLDQLLMSYRDYQDVDTGKLVDGSGKQKLENVEVVHTHVYDDEGRCKSGDFAYAHARIVNSPNAEVDRFYEDFEEALSAALLPENAGCTLELWWENPNANEKNGGAGYLINSGKFTLDLRDRCMEHDFVTDAPEYVLKHTGGELTLTASGGYEMGMLRAYGPVKALGIDGGHVRIDDGRYMWIWHKDYDNEDNSGCIVELRSGVLEINGGTFSSVFSDQTPADEKNDPKILINGGSLTVTGKPVFDAAMEVAADFTKNSGTIALSGGTFFKIISKAPSLTIAGMLAPNYLCCDENGSRISYADLKKAELENFSVVKCAIHEDGDSNGFCDYCNANMERDSAAKVETKDGETLYCSDLKTAFEQASDGGTLTLLNDATLTEGITIKKNLTLDLNGKTITGQVKDALLTVAAAVTICDSDSGNAGGIANTEENEHTVQVSTGGALTVMGGNFGDSNMGGGALCGDTGSDITLSGGTFKRGVFIYGKARITNGLFHGGVVIDKGSVSISGGEFTATVTLNNVSNVLTGGTFTDSISSNKPLQELLADGYAFKRSGENGAWLTQEERAQNEFQGSVIVTKAPITRVTLTARDKTTTPTTPIPEATVEYGLSGNVRLEMNFDTLDPIASVNHKWYSVAADGTTSEVSVSSSYDLPSGLEVGAYTYRIIIKENNTGYVVSKDITVTITKADLSRATVEQAPNPNDPDKTQLGNTPAKDGRLVVFPYLGKAETLGTVTYYFKVTCNGNELELNKDYTIEGNSNTALQAGEHTLTIKGAGNYTGEKRVTWEIKPYRLGNMCSADIEKVYDGTTELKREYMKPTNMALFNKIDSTENPDIGPFDTVKLSESADIELSDLHFDSADAGDRTASFTVTLKNNNFVFANGTRIMTVQMSRELNPHGSNYTVIDKATVPTAEHGTLTVYNRSAQTYEVDLNALLPAASVGEYGTITYAVGSVSLESYYVSGAAIENGKLLLPIENVSSTTTGKIGTVTVNVETTNYEDFSLIIDVSAANRSSSGGSGGSTTYPVNTPSSTENGSVTVSPKNATKGSTVTVTVTPDSGYELDTITVKDTSGSTLKLTDKGDGRYTFTMPAGKVEVKATFTKEVETSPFRDVATDAYCYEAVKWAVSKGITTGTSATTFGPNDSCTRAQMVTFLWRAASSPEPKALSSFSDVPADSYYAKAVAWAVENGITTGTGDGKFSPDATCTRAQSVTFLFRAAEASADGIPTFADVAADAYYAEAVKWAADCGITNGIGNGLFGPDNACTRAQIVTFLWKLYASK